MPKVTILLLTYKSKPAYLIKSIDSALNQTFTDFELLVIDDGPGDNNKAVLSEYKAEDERIRIIRNKSRIGRLKSRNKGLKKAKGEYIAVLDSDDFWCDRDKLKKQVDFLKNHPDYGAVGTAMFLVDKDGKKIGQIKYPTSNQEIRKYMLSSFQMAHPSILFRKKVTKAVGFYSENRLYKFGEDYEYFLRMGEKYKLANLVDYCLSYRIHPGSGSIKNEFKQRLTGLLLTLKYFGKYPNGISALLKKFATLFLPRSVMDRLIKENKFLSKIYENFTGIKKNF